ncbi:hypothetical protein V6N12_032947 [Hibiscus sabdariffa]|uniref:RNase H type-1 domain-containing protein n=1 Tax=Hibiscus sabdariffa TaxID=183260 RepID=A0ABR2BEW3_9ROSI
MYIQEADASTLPRPSPSIVRSDRWSPPTDDLFKANSDASFNNGTYPNRFVASPELAEAIACEHTLIFLKDFGFRRAIVEGDSLSVIPKLRHPPVSRSILSVHLENILRRQRDFDHISFSE